MKFIGPYIPPTLTVDGVVFQLGNSGVLEVLLIQRSQDPFKGLWALPGGYNAAGDTTLEALAHIVKRKAGLILSHVAYIEQLSAFDTIARDPRGHAVSIVYLGFGRELVVGDGSETTCFFALDTLPELAYDHSDIINLAHERLISKLNYTNIIYSLLPDKFTLTHLQKAYEAILGHELDKRNFRKKFLSLGFISETNETWREGAHRPAKLYKFISRTLQTETHTFE